MADPNQLSRQERCLVHQIHRAKLATNVSVSVGSTTLFWQPPARARPAGVHGAAPVASALVLRLDLSGYRDSAAGRYVLAQMPLSMQAIRSLSAVTIAVGGWRRSLALIVTEAALVGLGWSTGCSPAHRHSNTPPPGGQPTIRRRSQAALLHLGDPRHARADRRSASRRWVSRRCGGRPPGGSWTPGGPARPWPGSRPRRRRPPAPRCWPRGSGSRPRTRSAPRRS